MFMRFRAVVALDPAADLAFEIALRLAEIGETDGAEIEAVKLGKIVYEGFAEASGDLGGEIQVRRNVLAKNDAVDGLH